MLPVLSAIVAYLAIFEFKIWASGQVNALIGIVTIAAVTNLFYYGHVDIAYILAILGVCCLIVRAIYSGRHLQ